MAVVAQVVLGAGSLASCLVGLRERMRGRVRALVVRVMLRLGWLRLMLLVLRRVRDRKSVV